VQIALGWSLEGPFLGIVVRSVADRLVDRVRRQVGEVGIERDVLGSGGQRSRGAPAVTAAP
jgi:hypothetical protein